MTSDIEATTTNGSARKTTRKKSQYFSAASESLSEASSFENEESRYEDEDAFASAISSPPVSSAEPSSSEPSSEDERPTKKRKRGVGKEKTNKKVLVKTNEEGAVVGDKGQELWRPGVKSKLAPGEAVFVALQRYCRYHSISRFSSDRDRQQLRMKQTRAERWKLA